MYSRISLLISPMILGVLMRSHPIWASEVVAAKTSTPRCPQVVRDHLAPSWFATKTTFPHMTLFLKWWPLAKDPWSRGNELLYNADPTVYMNQEIPINRFKETLVRRIRNSDILDILWGINWNALTKGTHEFAPMPDHNFKSANLAQFLHSIYIYSDIAFVDSRNRHLRISLKQGQSVHIFNSQRSVELSRWLRIKALSDESIKELSFTYVPNGKVTLCLRVLVSSDPQFKEHIENLGAAADPRIIKLIENGSAKDRRDSKSDIEYTLQLGAYEVPPFIEVLRSQLQMELQERPDRRLK